MSCRLIKQRTCGGVYGEQSLHEQLQKDHAEEYAFCCLSLDNRFRQKLLKLIRWRWFERIVILVIVINCVMLALYDPLDRLCVTKKCKTLEILEHFVFTFFTFEMCFKMIALGVFGKKGYFGDKWNLLDFLIVTTGITDRTGINNGGFLTIVRLGRVVRPLRAINRVPSIRILVSLLMDTIPMLGNVLVLAFLVFSCFGIVGVQIFQGKLRNRCFISSHVNNGSNTSFRTENYFVPEAKLDFVCYVSGDSGTQSCADIPKLVNANSCQQQHKSTKDISGNVTSCIPNVLLYEECRQEGPNPYYGSVSFDNIAMAWVFIYQIVTLEGWSDLMYLVQDAYSFWVWIYFVILISIGSFFLVNLALVVITMQFSETKRREIRIIKCQMSRTSSELSLYSDLNNIWLKVRKCFSFTRNFRSVHHIHQHVHVHQNQVYCPHEENPQNDETWPMFNLPNIEISCFEEDNNPNHLNRSISLPGSMNTDCQSHVSNLSNDEDKLKLKLLSTATMYDYSDHLRSFDQQPRIQAINKRSNSICSPCSNQFFNGNTFSVEAESVASVSIHGIPKGPVNSKTSLSLKINSSSGGCIKTHTTLDTKIPWNKTSILSCISQQSSRTKSRRSRAKRSSVSTNSFEVDDSNSDIASSSLFDLKNIGKYYVSYQPKAYQKFRMFCLKVTENKIIANLLMSIIMLNTICMAVEHHKQPEKMTMILEYMNLFFIWIFALEMAVKLFGMGPKLYFKYGFNCFDAFVVVLSVIELLFDSEKSGSFMVFRSLRLLRVFRLVRPMRYQIAVMLKTTSSVMTFFGLLFLFMFTFAVLGMNIFGGKFVFKDRDGKEIKSRSNFDSFFWSMTTVFQILTQEDWNLVMYDGMRSTSKLATIYFLLLMTIGYYVLLNLLVAILVEGFTTPLEKKRMIQEIASFLANKKKMDVLKRTISLPDIKKGKSSFLPKRESFNLFSKDINLSTNLINRLGMRRRTLAVFNQDNDDPNNNEQNNRQYAKTSIASTCSTTPTTRKRSPKGDPVLLSARSSDCHGFPSYSFPQLIQQSPVRKITVQHNELNIYKEMDLDDMDDLFPKKVPFFIRRENWSMYLFSPDSKLREYLKRLKDSNYFDYFILVLIIYSCVLLALETPKLDPQSKLREVIDTSSFVLTWVFLAEMMVKVIADGLFMNENSYLRNGWNALDGFLIVISLIDIIVQFSFSSLNKKSPELFKGLRVLRASRALRPLRVIRKAPGLKLVVQALLYSLKPIGNTVLIAVIFFAVFGILGVQLFKGAFYFCHGVELVDTIRNKTGCLANPNGKWLNYQYNFDNLFEALMSLFVVSTKDGWVDLMRRGIDARGVDLEPQVNYAPWRVLYFVFFILIGGFLVLNMLVGVVVENFQKCQELQEKQNKTSAPFEKWRKMACQNKFWENYGPYRMKVYNVCTHAYWDMFIGIIIFVNVVIMASEHYNMSEGFTLFLEYSNIAFTSVYVLEAALLLAALGPRRYFKDKWYCFDMLIVVVSVLGIFIEELQIIGIKINATAIRAMRMLRVVRVLKLLKIAKGLRFLLDRVGDTIPQVTNLALLFLLLFFIYSCIGMQLFGTLECNSQYPCAGLGRHANFRSLGSSMLTLFRIATGDNWSGILKDTLRPTCDGSINCRSNCCTSRYVAPFFFVSFVLFAQFVLVNIVIAVLMKHLQFPDNRKRVRRKGFLVKRQSLIGKLSNKIPRKLSCDPSDSLKRRRKWPSRKKSSKCSNGSKLSVASSCMNDYSNPEKIRRVNSNSNFSNINREKDFLSPSFAAIHNTFVPAADHLYESYKSEQPSEITVDIFNCETKSEEKEIQTSDPCRNKNSTSGKGSRKSIDINEDSGDYILSCQHDSLTTMTPKDPTNNLKPFFYVGSTRSMNGDKNIMEIKGKDSQIRLSSSTPNISKAVSFVSLSDCFEDNMTNRSFSNSQILTRKFCNKTPPDITVMEFE